jgi:hypothetical protein
MAAAAAGRQLSVALDGFDKAVVRPIVAELVIEAPMLAAHLA